jgi:hypothetical protein
MRTNAGTAEYAGWNAPNGPSTSDYRLRAGENDCGSIGSVDIASILLTLAP